MHALRDKMEAIKDKIYEADELAENIKTQTAEKGKMLLQAQLHIEELQRHKQSIALRIASANERLQIAVEKLQLVQGKDKGHLQAKVMIENRGEVHDVRITELCENMSNARRQLDERSALLEDGKRKVDVLKRELEVTNKEGERRVRKVKELEELLQDSDTKLNQFESKDRENVDKEYSLEILTDNLRERVKINSDRIDMAERQIPSLQHQIGVVKQEICATRKDTAGIEEELHQTQNIDV